MERKGIDVSTHNGKLDWDKIKASGVDFAIIRTGFGKSAPSQKDKQFERNYTEAKRVGIPIGAYHYSYAQSVEQAVMEAEFVIEILKGKQFEYPIYFDIEDTTQMGLSMTLCGNIIRAFCNKLESAGYWSGIYSFDDFFRAKISDDIEKRYAVWVAKVPKTSLDNGATILKPTYATVYQMHQYTWKAKIPGSSLETDMNVCYVDYPTAIKNAKKNGYGNIPKYTITATKTSVLENDLVPLENSLKSLGMTITRAIIP